MFLDTVMLVRGIWRNNPERDALLALLKSGEELFACSMAWAEFISGEEAVRSPNEVARVRDMLSGVVPVLEEDAELAGELYNQGGRRKGSLADCIIAAIAIRKKQPLMSANEEDFERFEGCGLELVR